MRRRHRVVFQSTPPARGATIITRRTGDISGNFNPRPPRGGRLPAQPPPLWPGVISIHAPREGGDSTACLPTFCGKVFQSTPPARGATPALRPKGQTGSISIHAPREGGDFSGSSVRSWRSNFNPRPPRGGRRHLGQAAGTVKYFNPRPREGGDIGIPNANTDKRISIHAPREGGDCVKFSPCAGKWTFQSTPPARGATWRDNGARHDSSDFNPRPPRGGRLGRVV